MIDININKLKFEKCMGKSIFTLKVSYVTENKSFEK